MSDKTKQITTLDGFAGKTIERAHLSGNHIAFCFTDGSYALVSASHGYDNDIDLGVEKDNEVDNYTLHELGIISKEEYKRRCDEAQRAINAVREAYERREFERLRAKFGK